MSHLCVPAFEPHQRETQGLHDLQEHAQCPRRGRFCRSNESLHPVSSWAGDVKILNVFVALNALAAKCTIWKVPGKRLP